MVTLRVAKAAGLDVDGGTFKGGIAWIDRMTEPEFGVVGYQNRGGPSMRSAEKMDSYDPEEVATLTHMAVAARSEASPRSRRADLRGRRGTGRSRRC